MKKLILAAAAATFAVPAAAAPGNTATATDGSADAVIVSPITITHTSGATLNFGTIVPDTTGNSVVEIDTSGNGSVLSGGAVVVDNTAWSADSFDVRGDANRGFSIATTGGSVTALAGSMSFTTTYESSNGSGSLDSNGEATFSVGGELTVGANQGPGTYHGTYSATVTYN